MNESETRLTELVTPAVSARELARQPLMILLAVCYVFCIALVVFIFFTIFRHINVSSDGGRLFMVRLMQTTLGILIGVTFAIMGVYAISIGLIEASRIEVSQMGKMASAGPGSLLVICGTAVIALCLTREFEVTETTSSHGSKIENLDEPNKTQPQREVN